MAWPLGPTDDVNMSPIHLWGFWCKKKPRPSCCTRPFYSIQVHTLLATGKIQLTIWFCFFQLVHQQNAIFQSFCSFLRRTLLIDKDGGLMQVLMVACLERVHCSMIVDWSCFDRLYCSTCSFSVVILLWWHVHVEVILLNPCNR